MNPSEIQQRDEQWTLSYHQWVTCESYLGHCPEFNGSTQFPSIEERLERVVATLHRRTTEATYVRQKAYICVMPTGLQLSVNPDPSSDRHEVHNPGQQRNVSNSFHTSRIARCTSNHQACPRIFLWVCKRPDGDEMECHGVLCQSARDAIRLAHTLSSAFQYMYQQQQSTAMFNPHRSVPMQRGNTLPPLALNNPLAYHQQEIPFADLALLPTYNAQSPRGQGNPNLVRGNEVSHTFAGDMTLAISTSAPPAYQSRPGSAMSLTARRVASPVLSDGAGDGMTYLD